MNQVLKRLATTAMASPRRKSCPTADFHLSIRVTTSTPGQRAMFVVEKAAVVSPMESPLFLGPACHRLRPPSITFGEAARQTA